MSALLRQFVKRGVALNALRTQQNLQNMTPIGLFAPRFLSKTKEPNETLENKTSAKAGEDVNSGDNAQLSKAVYDRLVNSNKVVVFMKGNPKSPRCGFSNAVVQIFRMHGVEYDAHDVLENDEVREGIKKYTDWPTIPQVFINGEFVGGCDILLEMHQSGELISQLRRVGIVSDLLKMENEIADKEVKSKGEKENNNRNQ